MTALRPSGRLARLSDGTKGIAAILLACTIWGFATLYYKALAHVPPLEVLAHRSLWTLVFFGLLLALQRRLRAAPALVAGPLGWRVLGAAGIVSVNWGLFIWAIQSGHAVQASLGYYILPLVSVVMGVLLLKERLTAGQGVAVALAALAVVVLTFGLGVLPWVSLALALSFAPYLVIKKKLAAPAVVSVTAEVLVIAPFALALLVWQGGGAFFADIHTALMLPLSGLITGGPLILFSWGAQRVRLSTLGLAQYLNPTLQMYSAVMIFGEPFTLWHGIAFAMIWAALAIYSAEVWRQDRASRSRASSVDTSATVLK